MTNIPNIPTEDWEKDKKGKSKSAGKEKSSTDKKDSPYKKGKKGKKVAKQEKIYVESNSIPLGVTKGLNLYRPDRGTMQRLVKRASDLKDLKKEKDRIDITLFKDVAPWFYSKKVNEDLEGLEEGMT